MRSIKEIRASVRQVSERFSVDDYVFACKYLDSDPKDRWAVGLVKEVNLGIGNGKAGVLIDAASGYYFKYATKISAGEGRKILRYWQNRYK